MMKTAGDDLGYVGKVRPKATGESSREKGIGVVETAHLSGIVDMVLLDVGLDLLVILYSHVSWIVCEEKLLLFFFFTYAVLESNDGAVERRVKVGDGVGTEQEKVVVQCDDGVGL